MRRLEEVTHPKPEADFLYKTFDAFAQRYPWARAEGVQPKSIAREMVERYLGFRDYVAELSLARIEGLLLRYLSQVHKALVKSLPDAAKTDAVSDVIAFLRAAIAGVDTSLLEAWESLVSPTPAPGAPEPALAPRFALAAQARPRRGCPPTPRIRGTPRASTPRWRPSMRNAATSSSPRTRAAPTT